jgi:hypothetical protein
MLASEHGKTRLRGIATAISSGCHPSRVVSERTQIVSSKETKNSRTSISSDDADLLFRCADGRRPPAPWRRSGEREPGPLVCDCPAVSGGFGASRLPVREGMAAALLADITSLPT